MEVALEVQAALKLMPNLHRLTLSYQRTEEIPNLVDDITEEEYEAALSQLRKILGTVFTSVRTQDIGEWSDWVDEIWTV